MKLSKLFTKTRHDPPSDEESKNGQLLIQAGYVHKEMAGVYAYLPLGLRVFNKIVQIIREEMNTAGGQELVLTALQRSEPWEASDRWSDEVVDVWFRTKLANGSELGLANTHEEVLTDMMRQYISSYKDLPSYPYQFQTKFRNELRAKSGIMRGREFVMKDLYSFSLDETQHEKFYDLMMNEAYPRVFERLGLGDTTYLTFASGGSFAKFSHEFQTVCDAGEDVIYIDHDKKIAINEEVYNDDVISELGVDKSKLDKQKAAEVGNIFTLGTRFSEALNLKYTNQEGSEQHVFMGSYGIGPGRTMGVIVESFADEKGLVWPESVAPFMIHIVAHEKAMEEAAELYNQLQSAGVEVLFDDRNERFGAKLKDADMLGVPYRVVASPRSLKDGGFELKPRVSDDTEIASTEELLSRFS